jgi:hypothetical protein
MTEPNLEKVIVFGINREENSGAVDPNEPVLCGLSGYTNEELDDFRKRYLAGSLPDYEIGRQKWRISPIHPRLTMMLVP